MVSTPFLVCELPQSDSLKQDSCLGQEEPLQEVSGWAALAPPGVGVFVVPDTRCYLCTERAVAPDAAYQCLLLLLSNAGRWAQPGEEEEKDDGGVRSGICPALGIPESSPTRGELG